jgi:hypothetical protein
VTCVSPIFWTSPASGSVFIGTAFHLCQRIFLHFIVVFLIGQQSHSSQRNYLQVSNDKTLPRFMNCDREMHVRVETDSLTPPINTVPASVIWHSSTFFFLLGHSSFKFGDDFGRTTQNGSNFFYSWDHTILIWINFRQRGHLKKSLPAVPFIFSLQHI